MGCQNYLFRLTSTMKILIGLTFLIHSLGLLSLESIGSSRKSSSEPSMFVNADAQRPPSLLTKVGLALWAGSLDFDNVER